MSENIEQKLLSPEQIRLYYEGNKALGCFDSDAAEQYWRDVPMLLTHIANLKQELADQELEKLALVKENQALRKLNQAGERPMLTEASVNNMTQLEYWRYVPGAEKPSIDGSGWAFPDNPTTPTGWNVYTGPP